MTLSEDLQWRGLIKDKTFSNIDWLNTPASFYLGIDASADSLTVGNLAVIMLVHRLADAGWKAFLVMGGGTSLVGDPGGKSEERNLMNREMVKKNIAAVQQQVTKLFRNTSYKIVDNYDWLSTLKYVDFLREVGKHFSMTELIQRDFVVERMGEGGAGISYAEFSYSLVQGYDFWHLFNKYGVTMQLGGSDQWGNLLSGVSLIRKKEGKEAHALSMPLIINKVTGQKFGKSEDGAIWLDENKTSVYKFYQFWLNVDDQSVADYLKVYTELDKNQIGEIMRKFEADKGQRLAQKTLAQKVTKIVHGADRLAAVQKATAALFGEGEFLALDPAEVDLLKQELTVIPATHEDPIASVITAAGLASSNSEASRFIVGGSVTINGVKVTPESIEFFRNGSNLLKQGKNSFAIVEIK